MAYRTPNNKRFCFFDHIVCMTLGTLAHIWNSLPPRFLTLHPPYKYSFDLLGMVALLHRYESMQSQIKEPWWELAEQAAVEKNLAKLLRLMTEINRLLEEKKTGS